jgi:hypothetical protein
VTTVHAKRHAATWLPDELLPWETWLLVLTKVDGAVVMYLGPTRVGAGAPAGAAVAAPAVDTGTAIAIALRAAAIPTRRVRVGFMSNLPFNLCVRHLDVDPPPAAGVAPVVLGA